MTDLLARYAARRVHVLIVEVPGDWVLRAAVERCVAARGWCAAISPADADVLAVCGFSGPELAEVVDRIWDQLPGPRARIDITDEQSIDSVLDRAAAELLDSGRQRDDGRDRAQSPDPTGDQQGQDHGDMDHHGMDHSAHHGMDHHGHHDMDYGGMQMAPAGIALAEGGEDRDGLEMDVLHVRLGPVLSHWPAGLVLRCSLQGDVLSEVEAWIVDTDHEGRPQAPPENTELVVAARQCDPFVDLLELVGWWRASAIARQARDLLLDGSDVDRAQQLLEKLHGELRRSRMLRWSLRDLAPLSAENLDRYQLPAALAGDAYDRLLARVGLARTNLREPSTNSAFRPDLIKFIDVLPSLVQGLDVATARLVVASLGIDTGARDERSPHG